MPGDVTAGGVVRRYLIEQLDQLSALTPETLGDPDVIHDTRVALRRIRSTLRTFGDLFQTDQATRFAAGTRWLSGLLGDIRDRDVLIERLAEHAADDPKLAPALVDSVLAELIEQRDYARHAAAEELTSDRYAELLDLITTWRQQPPLTDRAAGSAELIMNRVHRANRTERKRMQQATRASASDADLHRARKAAKRHRYALEVEAKAEDSTKAARASAKKRKKRAKRSRRLQDLLGRHQDAVVAADLLARRDSDDPDQSLVRRRLRRRQRAIAKSLREQLGSGR